MPDAAVSPLLQRLGQRETWLRVLTYALFAFSTFSIIGIDAAAILLLAVVLYHRLRAPVAEPLPRWLVGAFLLLPAAALLAALANGHEAAWAGPGQPPSVWHSLGLTVKLYRLALPLALLPALACVDRRRLLQVLGVGAALMALYAAVQFHWGVDWFRPAARRVVTPFPGVPGVFFAHGNFSEHLTFAGVMLMLAPLFASLASAEHGRARAGWGGAALLVAGAVLVSLSRGGWLGLAVGLALLALDFPRRLGRPLAVLALGAALAWALLGTGWLEARLGGPERPALVQRLLSSSLAENRERILLWQSALLGLRDRPWLGVGYHNYPRYVRPYREAIQQREQTTFQVSIDTHMHNVYLQVGFDLGLIGLAAYLLWWGAIFRWNRMWLLREEGRFPFERALLRGASAGLAGILAAGFFENNFFDAEVQTTIMILIGLALHAGLQIRRGHEDHPALR